MLQGYRTLIVGLGWVVLPPALEYVAKIDWTQYLSPTWAPVAAGISMIVMRMITATGVLKK